MQILYGRQHSNQDAEPGLRLIRSYFQTAAHPPPWLPNRCLRPQRNTLAGDAISFVQAKAIAVEPIWQISVDLYHRAAIGLDR